ncbi:repressible alkaline phosphatase [Paramyrothecium foliicola]|nr:repressible alkaline phosphatase [Paramyrothecium foliicola]
MRRHPKWSIACCPRAGQGRFAECFTAPVVGYLTVQSQPFKMRSSAVLAGAVAPVALAAIAPKNVIFIVPDGLAPAGQTVARTYKAVVQGNSLPNAPGEIPELPVDRTPIGNTRTHSSNRLITDSAAAGTALAAGHKTENGAIGVLPNGQPVGTILEAAKLHGYHTGLVVTSTINHATPAAYSAHVNNRNALGAIAEQQIGYSGGLGQSVDVLLGGGRCHFRPQGTSGSCRSDDVDLFKFAADQGYYVAQNRSAFEDFESGLGSARLPILGLFHDSDLSYEIDRQQQPADEREPSLTEMTETALNALHRATHCKDKGFFMMIEASRIDHASHAHDSVAHLWDVLEYNNVVDVVTKWIDDHPDTVMVSVADHETGGLTLTGYDPRPLKDGKHSVTYLADQWSDYEGDDRRGFLVGEILPAYGIADATEAQIESLLNANNFAQTLADIVNSRSGIAWSTGGHSGVDTTLYAYGAGDLGKQLKLDLAGSWDNTHLPKYLAEALKVDLDEVTALLRENGTDWIP